MRSRGYPRWQSPLRARVLPPIDGLKEVNPVSRGAPRVGPREGPAIAGFKGANALKRKVNPTRVPIEEMESARWLENLH